MFSSYRIGMGCWPRGGRFRYNPAIFYIDPMNRPMSQCPCGSSLSLPQCCGALHEGQAAATTEQLMRSRYSAFVLDRLDYLLASWHPDTRPASIEPNEPGLRWLGLEVKRHQRQDADHATVEFVARSKLGGRAHRLHEVSRFERIDGRWYNRDGDLSSSR